MRRDMLSITTQLVCVFCCKRSHGHARKKLNARPGSCGITTYQSLTLLGSQGHTTRLPMQQSQLNWLLHKQAEPFGTCPNGSKDRLTWAQLAPSTRGGTQHPLAEEICANSSHHLNLLGYSAAHNCNMHGPSLTKFIGSRLLRTKLKKLL